MGHHKLPLFDHLRGNVSHKALDLIHAEKTKLAILRTSNASCGCQLFTSCGLPCACRLAKYERTNTPIPLDAVDTFWKKLNWEAEKIDNEEIDVEKELDAVKQQIESQPYPVKKSLLSKIKAVVTPTKSTKKPPVVQKDTRGRPTAKSKQENEPARHSSFIGSQQEQEPARHSSFIGSQQSIYEPSRHSSYVPSQENQKASLSSKSTLQRSCSTTSKVKNRKSKTQYESTPDKDFPLLVAGRHKNNITRFKDWIPPVYHRYISNIQDVMPDGNCGFRSVALGLGFDQQHWIFVRQQLLEEMDTHEQQWRHIFDNVVEHMYDEIRDTINWLEVQGASERHWMWMPYTGLLIAQKFGVAVHFISLGASSTFFPLWNGPNNNRNHHIVTFAFVNNNHYINLSLDGDYPMAVPNGMWSLYRTEEARVWESLYEDRITHYKAQLRSNKNKYVKHIFDID